MEKKNWIQKAVNKEHKGYCTPMTKATCTPKRKALAETFKAKKWKHEKGGKVENTFGQDQPFPKPMKKDKKGGKLSKEYIKKAHEKPGGSNVGKKKFASGEKRTGPYVGPSGGSPKGSYPIPDVKHAKAAIKLSGHAPNPEGIKKAVYKKFPQLKKKQDGGTLDKGGDKGGDQAAAYKKGDKVKQMGGQIYGAAKKGTKIDASKWKKSK